MDDEMQGVGGGGTEKWTMGGWCRAMENWLIKYSFCSEALIKVEPVSPTCHYATLSAWSLLLSITQSVSQVDHSSSPRGFLDSDSLPLPSVICA